MAMAQKNGNCPRLGQDISFEMQYNEKDGGIEYIDCSCSEMICCMEYDEVQCPKIWIDFFNATFGTNVSLREEPFAPAGQQGEAPDTEYQEGGSPQTNTGGEEGESPPREDTDAVPPAG